MRHNCSWIWNLSIMEWKWMRHVHISINASRESTNLLKPSCKNFLHKGWFFCSFVSSNIWIITLSCFPTIPLELVLHNCRGFSSLNIGYLHPQLEPFHKLPCHYIKHSVIPHRLFMSLDLPIKSHSADSCHRQFPFKIRFGLQRYGVAFSSPFFLPGVKGGTWILFRSPILHGQKSNPALKMAY